MLSKTFGKSFLKRCKLTNTSSFKDIKKKLLWGTYGKPANYRNLRWVTLESCSTEHLKNILSTQYQIPDITRKIIKSILSDRGVYNDSEIIIN